MGIKKLQKRLKREKIHRLDVQFAFQQAIEQRIKERDNLNTVIDQLFNDQRERYDISTGRIQVLEEMANDLQTKLEKD